MKGTVEGNLLQHLKNILIITEGEKVKCIIFKDKVKQMPCSLVAVVGLNQ